MAHELSLPCTGKWGSTLGTNIYRISFSCYIKGLMHVNGRPVAAFDPEGLIFAAGVDSEMVKLYDLRSFDKVIFTSKHFKQ